MPSVNGSRAPLLGSRRTGRRLPNILICGTPGTGKSSLASRVASDAGNGELSYINLSKYALDHNLVDGWDEVLNCAIFDEDKVLDHLEPRLLSADGGLILDYHSGEFLPEAAIDLVVVLRTDNTVLYDRLKARGYPEAKISNNLECEIFQTILDEAREAFPGTDKVLELVSDTPEEQTNNANRLIQFVTSWSSPQSTGPAV